jgi:hypothetical protein
MPVPDQTVSEGGHVTVYVAATNSRAGAKLKYSLAAGAPRGATINANTGVFTWSPSRAGHYKVTVLVKNNDPRSPRATETFMITVVP